MHEICYRFICASCNIYGITKINLISFADIIRGGELGALGLDLGLRGFKSILEISLRDHKTIFLVFGARERGAKWKAVFSVPSIIFERVDNSAGAGLPIFA